MNVDRGNFYGLTGRDFQKSRIDTSTITVEHDLTDSLTIRNTSRYGNSHQDYLWTQPDDSQGNINNGSVWRRQNNRVSTTTTAVNQTDLFGEFYLGGFRTASAPAWSSAEKTASAMGISSIPIPAWAATSAIHR